MTRRCKAGQRARIIDGSNKGKIVLVVRPYRGEEIDGSTWVGAFFPWVVASVSGTLTGFVFAMSGKLAPPCLVAVVDDTDLEPLDDDDDGLELTTVTEKPAAGSTTVQMPKRAPQIARKKPVTA